MWLNIGPGGLLIYMCAILNLSPDFVLALIEIISVPSSEPLNSRGTRWSCVSWLCISGPTTWLDVVVSPLEDPRLQFGGQSYARATTYFGPGLAWVFVP